MLNRWKWWKNKQMRILSWQSSPNLVVNPTEWQIVPWSINTQKIYMHVNFHRGHFYPLRSFSYRPWLTSKMKSLKDFSLSADYMSLHPHGETLWDLITFMWAITMCKHASIHCHQPPKCLNLQSIQIIMIRLWKKFIHLF